MKKTKYMVVVIFTCVLLLITPGFLLASGFLLPVQYENTFLGELKYKSQALEETKGKRIIILGGSSVAFGVDSGQIEENLPDYSVINYGMYAALGTTVMLDLSVDDIRAGDIVIISPEQEKQTLSDYFNGEAMWQAMDGKFSLLSRIPKENLGKLAGQFPYFAAGKFNYFIHQNAPNPGGVYCKDAFNEYGDIVAKECSSNIMSGQYDANTPISFEESILEEAFVAKVNAYTEEVTARGATVWYRFSPMNSLAVEDDSDIDGYYEYLQQKLDCLIIGDPNDCVMDAAWFYDTNFHLNASGKIINTYQMIRDIKAVIGESSATTIELPEKPEIESAVRVKGDNLDADYFTYEEQNGTLIITGLTEAGRLREELVIPVNVDNIEITTITTGAFTDNSSVHKITIQENITFISDYVFQGCLNLKQIIMLGQKPERCQVGQFLLEGTDANVVVSEAAISEYKVNYFWSSYGGRIVSP